MPTRYRKLIRADVGAAHRLSLEVGWPHRLQDWEFVQRLGAGHVALEAGAVVGTILTWKHDRRHAWMAAHVPVVSLARGERLRPVGASDVPKLAALATRAAGVSRARALPRLLEAGKGIVLARGEEMVGFAIFRRFGRGYAIGPVVAPDAARAQALVSHWVAMHPGKFLRIDVSASTGLGPWLDSIGLAKVDTVVTMVKGAVPARDESVRAYALVNQALG